MVKESGVKEYVQAREGRMGGIEILSRVEAIPTRSGLGGYWRRTTTTPHWALLYLSLSHFRKAGVEFGGSFRLEKPSIGGFNDDRPILPLNFPQPYGSLEASAAA